MKGIRTAAAGGRGARRRLAAALISAALASPAAGQTEPAGPAGWRPSLVGTVNFSQTSFSNWSQGGEDFAAWTFGATGGLNLDSSERAWKNSLKLEYGLVDQSGQEARKSVDQIFLESVHIWKTGWKVDPFLSATARTQFAEGKNYSLTPPGVTSDFADPLLLTQTAGFSRALRPGMETRLGFSMQETMTDLYPQYSDDPETAEIENTKVEAGLESVTQYEGKLREGLVAKSKLRGFYAFDQLDELDLEWQNDLTLAVVKNLSVNYLLHLLYDEDVLDRLQVKQFLGVGFSVTLID